MVAPIVKISNEVHTRQALAGYETTRGAGAVPTFRLPGEYTSNMDVADNTRPEATGGLDRRQTPRRGRATFSGTYAEDASFETLPRLMRIGLAGGDPVTGAGPAYTREQSPDFDRYAVDSIAVQHYVEGLGFYDKGVSFRQWNLAVDVDDADGVWKVSGDLFVQSSPIEGIDGDFEGVATGGTATTITMTGASWTVNEHAGKYVNLGVNSAGQVRQVVSNTATELTVSTAFDPVPVVGDVFRLEGKFTSGIARQTVEAIPSYGTKLYLDDVGDIGTTQIRQRVISVNLTVNHNLVQDGFLDDDIDTMSKLSPGEREITGQVRMEFDRRDELLQWRRLQTRALRIEQEGTEIEPGTVKLARIDLPVIHWGGPTRDTRNNNLTVTIPFRALLPDSDPIITVHTVNGLSSV